MKKQPGIKISGDKTTVAAEHETIGVSAVLYVTPNDADADGVFLRQIFDERDKGLARTLIARSTLDSAFSVLRETPVAIVVCEADLMPGTWKDMLEYISFLPDPPLLIITSPLADELLWAEALNLGAHDVLVKPFDAAEVRRIVALAWGHWQERHVLHCVRTQQRRWAAGA
jgi:AmiR/NasT family two-component response regulator